MLGDILISDSNIEDTAGIAVSGHRKLVYAPWRRLEYCALGVMPNFVTSHIAVLNPDKAMFDGYLILILKGRS